jgi:hypothetical protein
MIILITECNIFKSEITLNIHSFSSESKEEKNKNKIQDLVLFCLFLLAKIFTCNDIYM